MPCGARGGRGQRRGSGAVHGPGRLQERKRLLGHGAGDALLVAVAERLKNRVRPEDVLARFRGDEFAVLLESVEDPSEAIRVARRISEALGEPLA